MANVPEGLVEFHKSDPIPYNDDYSQTGQTEYHELQDVDRLAENYTNDFTDIESVDHAIEFVLDIVNGATPFEREFLFNAHFDPYYDIHHNISNMTLLGINILVHVKRILIETSSRDLLRDNVRLAYNHLRYLEYYDINFKNILSHVIDYLNIDYDISTSESHSQSVQKLCREIDSLLVNLRSSSSLHDVHEGTNDRDTIVSGPQSTQQIFNNLNVSEDHVFHGGVSANVYEKKDDPYDGRIFKLLQLADALHEFNPSEEKDEEFVRIPREAIHKNINAVLPYGLTIDEVADKIKFINFMKGEDILYFGNDKVSNPLHGIDFFTVYDLENLIQLVIDRPPSNGDNGNNLLNAYGQADENYRKISNKGISNVELWCPESKVPADPRHTINEQPFKSCIFLTQISQLRKEITKSYGNGETVFVVDASDYQLFRLLLSTSIIDQGITAVMQLYKGKSFNESVSQLLETNSQLQSILEDEKLRYPSNWKFRVCDANIIDGLRGKIYELPELCEEPTGNVSTIHDKDDVLLHGAKLVNGLCQAQFQIGGNESVEYDHDDYRFSVKSMRKAIVKKIRLNINAETYKKDVSFSDELVQKRSCDWGQVEHCRMYNSDDVRYVFVTYDRLAAQYAIYRNVDTIHLLRKHHITPHTSIDRPMLQCVFKLCRSTVASVRPIEKQFRAKLTRKDRERQKKEYMKSIGA